MILKFGALKLKVVSRELPGAKAVAAMDNNGQVLVLINKNLPRQRQIACSFWGIFQYLKLGLRLLRYSGNREEATEISMPPTRQMNSAIESVSWKPREPARIGQ